MDKTNAWLSWSTGKDCAYALYQLISNPNYEITGLITTLRTSPRSVAMHRVPEELLNRQATEIGLPLYCAEVGHQEIQQGFEDQIRNILQKAVQQNVTHIAFGDLFLEDIRAYREEKMKGTGLELLFPLWLNPTKDLARNIIAAGFKAIIVSVDLRVLPISFLGRTYDEHFLNDLPLGVDPCGEYGEFHTFVYDGPIFKNPILVGLGESKIEGDHGYIELNSV